MRTVKSPHNCYECKNDILEADKENLKYCVRCGGYLHEKCVEVHKDKWYHKASSEGISSHDTNTEIKNGKVELIGYVQWMKYFI